MARFGRKMASGLMWVAVAGVAAGAVAGAAIATGGWGATAERPDAHDPWTPFPGEVRGVGIPAFIRAANGLGPEWASPPDVLEAE